jgi:hypothetical protein
MRAKKRAGSTVTFSISVDQKAARYLKRKAKAAFGGNVSALVAHFAREQERRDAAESLLAGVEIDPYEYAEFIAEMRGLPTKKRRRAA